MWLCPPLPRVAQGAPNVERSHVLQAFVSEAIKPLLPGVLAFGAGHIYVSQSDKGGLIVVGDIDGYNIYAQRGKMPVMEDVCEGGMALMPMICRVRLLRQWGGIMDMPMNGSPFINKTPIGGLYHNAGWCYGGFKATPASGLCFAHLLAKDESYPEARLFRPHHFLRSALIDKMGVDTQPNLH
jgi:sarcosine oxidase subunit beta